MSVVNVHAGDGANVPQDDNSSMLLAQHHTFLKTMSSRHSLVMRGKCPSDMEEAKLVLAPQIVDMTAFPTFETFYCYLTIVLGWPPYLTCRWNGDNVLPSGKVMDRHPLVVSAFAAWADQNRILPSKELLAVIACRTYEKYTFCAPELWGERVWPEIVGFFNDYYDLFVVQNGLAENVKEDYQRIGNVFSRATPLPPIGSYIDQIPAMEVALRTILDTSLPNL